MGPDEQPEGLSAALLSRRDGYAFHEDSVSSMGSIMMLGSAAALSTQFYVWLKASNECNYFSH